MRQWELADMLYLSHNRISDYARGHCEPCIQTLCMMADIFGVTVDYLVGRTEVK
jgi:transcriptional regulator with XRE-family HTH domain